MTSARGIRERRGAIFLLDHEKSKPMLEAQVSPRDKVFSTPVGKTQLSSSVRLRTPGNSESPLLGEAEALPQLLLDTAQSATAPSLDRRVKKYKAVACATSSRSRPAGRVL